MAATPPFPAQRDVSALLGSIQQAVIHATKDYKKDIIRENRLLIGRFSEKIGNGGPSTPNPSPLTTLCWLGISFPADLPTTAPIYVDPPVGPPPLPAHADSGSGGDSDDEWLDADAAYRQSVLRSGVPSRIKRCTVSWIRRYDGAGKSAGSGPGSTLSTLSVSGRRSIRIRAEFTVMKLLPTLPTSSWWIPVRKNYTSDDQPDLDYIPYFGDDANASVLEDVYKLRARQDLVSLRKQAYDVDCMAFALCAASAHMSQCESSSHGALTHSGLYQVAQALPILPDVIASLERGAGQEARPPEPRVPSPGPCSVESITAEACGGRLFAPVPWNLKDQPLEHWASTAGVQCGPSLLPMMDASARAMLVSALTEPAVKVAPATAIADELDTYATLFCRRCYVFDCRLHGAAIAAPRHLLLPRAVRNERKPVPVVPLPPLPPASSSLPPPSSPPHVNPKAARSVPFLLRRLHELYTGDAGKVANVMKVSVVEVLEGWAALGLPSNDECPLLSLDSLLPEGDAAKRSVSHPSSNGKHSKTRLYLGTAASYAAFNRRGLIGAYHPCAHTGPCNEECPCAAQGHRCEKYCNCAVDCPNRWPGCTCKGKCTTKACPCFASGRECDPDLCGVCGVAKAVRMLENRRCAVSAAATAAGAPVVTAHGNREWCYEQLVPLCSNLSLQAGLHKRTFVGPSVLAGAGWGLFLGETAQKNDLIAEYCGQVVSQEEADRRGTIYDALNRSYLFNLNADQVVDATKSGNKMRYANHADRPNCDTRIMLVNGDHRIGIYANRLIESGDELFFNYMYESEQTSKDSMLVKQAVTVHWMSDASLAGKVTLPGSGHTVKKRGRKPASPNEK